MRKPVFVLLLRLLLIGLIGVAHIMAMFILFPWTQYEILRFALPAAVAFCLYLLVLGRSTRSPEAAALILTFLSFWGGMVAALNTYGS